MQEQVKQQQIPVNMYRTNGRLMVTTPMPGLEPENMTIEVTSDGCLILQGVLRGMLKEHDGKQRFLDEWHIGAYEREVALPASYQEVFSAIMYEKEKLPSGGFGNGKDNTRSTPCRNRRSKRKDEE